MSAIFFPLRTSVELFEDPASPNAVIRAKEAAVLYDRVIFEAGLLDVTITPSGATKFWTPPRQLTPELLERTRMPIPVGSPVTFAMGAQPAPDVAAPPEAMHVFLHDKVSVRYVAEFHSGIMKELARFEPDWAVQVALGGGDQPRSVGDGVYDAIRHANFGDFSDRELLRDKAQFERSFIYQSFNRDSVLAAAMEASFSITPLFAPMLAQRGVGREHPGSEALDILVPNIGALPWESVVEFREHAGATEARARLREFERAWPRSRSPRMPTTSSSRSHAR